MKCFWMSWYQQSEDYRPLTYPPNAAILGWWCSGHREDETACICDVVRAHSEADAVAAILLDWPEASEFRFCTEQKVDFQPGDRFPLLPWMVERFAVSKEGA